MRRPFVGRERELAILRGHVGRAGLVAVTGEPGIGKTRLAEELASDAEAEGTRVYWGRCWEDDGAPAFWPWIQILRELQRGAGGDGAIDAVLADLEGRLAGAVDEPGIDPAPSRFRLFDAVTRCLVAVADADPLVLLLEDVHWADLPSMMLLQFLVRHARTAAILVIVTYREGEIAHALATPLAELLRHGELMPLAGLAASDVERYVAATLGDERARVLATRLHRETEGHPFFLVEMVRLLEASTAAALAGIPAGVRDLIARRFRQRSANCGRVLQVAAVVGLEFDVPLLRRVPALAAHDVLAALDEAIASRLVVPGERTADDYRFGHALVREALYAELPRTERVVLHREIADAIAAGACDLDAHAAELAHHFREAAADGDVERALTWTVRAAERATRALAHEEAAAHYGRALSLLERATPVDEARRCALLIALGLAQVRTGDPSAAEAVFTRAGALARTGGFRRELARVALGFGEITRQNARLVPLLEEALAGLDGGDSVLRARLLARLAVALYWSQSEDRKRALSDEAVAMARRLGYLPTLAYTLSSRIAALSGPDDVEARLAASREIVALAEQCDDRELAMIGHGWTLADGLALGDVPRARRALAEFTALAEASRHPYFAWWLAALRTMQAIVDGRLADADRLAEECFRRGRRAVEIDAMQVFAGHVYVLRMEARRYDELEPLMHGVVAQFPEIPSPRIGLALLHADRGRLAEAAAELDRLAPDRFGALPRNPEWLTSMAALAQTSAALPGAPHAATLYELLAPYRDRVIVAGMGVLVAGSVAHFLGTLATRLGRFDEAERHLAEALAVHERLEAPALRAYTQYQLATLALARGDDPTATRHIAEARAYAEPHDMHRLVHMLAALAPVSAAEPETSAVPSRTAVLRKEGDFWRVRWEQSEFRLRDRIGLQYLAALIARAGRDIVAVDLVRTTSRRRSSTPAAADGPDTGTIIADLGRARTLANAEATLDVRAELAYRTRLRELRDMVAEARRQNDLGRIAAAEVEADALTREVARSLGLGGRDSRSPIERARISATRAIRAAIQSIQENDRALGRHLSVTVKTGTFCSYVPDPELTVSWQL